MLLREYIKKLPRGERSKFRGALAEAHGCSVSLVRKWELDPPPEDWNPQQRRSLVRRHPSDLASIVKTEELTGRLVTRSDLRPECWSVSDE